MTKEIINSSIAQDIFPITPHATNPLPDVAYGIKVTGAGTVVGTTLAGVDRTVTLAAGENLHVIFTHIKTASTATGIHGFKLWV